MIIYYKYVIIIVYFIIENPMNENPIAIPSNKKYTWEKINLSKEALEKDIAQIKELDTATVWEKLMDYINHQPGKDKWKSTFEMMALYQRALQLLWYDITVDGLFWGNTLTTLKATQRDNLGFQWKDIDGLPGPKTTEKLIEILQKKGEEKIAAVEKPKEEGPSSDAEISKNKKKPLEKAAAYLDNEGFKKIGDWIYRGPDDDITITIQENSVDYNRDFWRAFGKWDLNAKENGIIQKLSDILKGKEWKITEMKPQEKAYLESEGFIDMGHGVYAGNDIMIMIRNDRVEYTHGYSENSKSRPLTKKEEEIIQKLSEILKRKG